MNTESDIKFDSVIFLPHLPRCDAVLVFETFGEICRGRKA